ncbi:unnamed protein product [Medioppia subpectinata]|uniref:sn-1-specific diacylglycerol lipase ABHD11 n=1 Tax=Medioppia subpectinata TaxID=1979941 RepID=A0A7R9KFV2_9ACAR|nr:unnamed protein product [Medioppia subpectinata]CAG2102789.1 unnamed protein product [Medioppia subpectinata]
MQSHAMNALKCNHFWPNRLLFSHSLRPVCGQTRWLSGDNRVRLSYDMQSVIDGQQSSLPPILIFHGLFGSKNNWKSISKSISSRTGRSVYALDLRNHGLSPHTSGTDSTLKAMATDIQLFLEENNLKTATLIGHSLGGRVVMQFSFLWPESVEKLVVVDISPLSSLPKVFFTKSTFTDQMSKAIEGIPKNTSLWEARKLVNENLKPFVSDQFIRGFFLMSLDKNSETSQLPFTGQTFLIHGQNSEYVKLDDYKAIRELIPNIQFECMAGTGHYLHVEKPNQFVDSGSILSSPLVPNLSNKRVDPLEDLLLENLPITKDWGHKVWLDKQKIGGYSVVNTEYKSGHSELKYLDIPSRDMSYNLLNGYTIDYNCEHECVMSFTAGKLLQWISNEGQEFMAGGDKLLDTDFVSGRWLLSYIMTFPYERMSSKILLATKFRGNIYMCWKNHSPLNTASIDDSLKHNFSERRFKQYLTTSAPDASRDRNQFDPDFSYYNAVVRTQLCNSRNSEVVTIDDPYVVYRFDFIPTEPITCIRLAEPGEYQVLPEWYIKEFKI